MQPDPSYQLYQNYSRHYSSMALRVERLPSDLRRLKRDRLPVWIDEVPRDARVLDLGCAQGDLLEALRRVGFVHLSGIDCAAPLLQQARERLGDKATLVEADLIEWLGTAPDSAYDLVFLHDVMEHLPRERIIQVLRDIHRILTPDGRFHVRVPNMGCLIGAYTMAIDFTHVTHFTEYALLQVLEAAGFDPERVRFESKKPRLFWSWRAPHRALLRLLNHLRWQLNRGLHRSLYLLTDMHPAPSQFDPNLIALARK